MHHPVRHRNCVFTRAASAALDSALPPSVGSANRNDAPANDPVPALAVTRPIVVHALATRAAEAYDAMAMSNRIESWTLADLHRLPEDGNRYELVRGDLFVTPPPSVAHQEIVDVLASLLHPYVMRHALGRLRFPRSVVRMGSDSEVEPDLMVRPVTARLPASWDTTPLPILVVEVTSATTRRRDRVEKRELYLRAGIPEYWIVDRERRSIRVVRPGADDVETSAVLEWRPLGETEPLTLDVAELFRAALRD